MLRRASAGQQWARSQPSGPDAVVWNAPRLARSKALTVALCHLLWPPGLLLFTGLVYASPDCAIGLDLRSNVEAGWRFRGDNASIRAHQLLFCVRGMLLHPMVWPQLLSSAAVLLLLLLVIKSRPRQPAEAQPQQPCSKPQQQQQQPVVTEQTGRVFLLAAAQLAPVIAAVCAYRGSQLQQLVVLEMYSPAPPASSGAEGSQLSHLLLAGPYVMLILLAMQAWYLQLPPAIQLLTSCLQSAGLAVVMLQGLDQVVPGNLSDRSSRHLHVVACFMHSSHVLPWLARWGLQVRSHRPTWQQQQQQQQQQGKRAAVLSSKKAGVASPDAVRGVPGRNDVTCSTSVQVRSTAAAGAGPSSLTTQPPLPLQQQPPFQLSAVVEQPSQQVAAQKQLRKSRQQHQQQHHAGAVMQPVPAATAPLAPVAAAAPVSPAAVQLIMPANPAAMFPQQPLQPPHTITVTAPDAAAAIQGVIAAVQAVTCARPVGRGQPGSSSGSLYSSLYRSNMHHLLLCIRLAPTTVAPAVAAQGSDAAAAAPAGLDAAAPAPLASAAAASSSARGAQGSAGDKASRRAESVSDALPAAPIAEYAGEHLTTPSHPASAGFLQRATSVGSSISSTSQPPPGSPAAPLAPMLVAQQGGMAAVAPAAVQYQQQLLLQQQLRAALEAGSGLPRLLSLQELHVPGWSDLLLTAAFAPVST